MGYNRKQQEARRNQKCVQCINAPVEPDRVRCRACLKHVNARERVRYHQRIFQSNIATK